MEYIKADAALRKIRQAYRSGTPVYISGSAGMGKTAAAKYFLRNQKYTLISALTSALNREPSAEELKEQVLVIDDLSNLSDPAGRDYVRQMIRSEKIPLILIGRGTLPGWLSAVSAEVSIEMVVGRQLSLSDENIRTLFTEKGISLTAEDIKEIRQDCWNNTWLMILAAGCAAEFGIYSREVLESARRRFYGYLDRKFYEQLGPDQRGLITSVAPFGSFSARFAQMLSADRRAPAMLERMSWSGDFLKPGADQTYRIAEPYRSYLVWKRGDQYSESEQREGNERAALYFELLDQPDRALECYRQIGDVQRMVRLLVKMIRRHPGVGHNLRTLYRYLRVLPDAAVNAQPVLMYGMSMVSSQTYHRDISEEWYRKLSKFRDSTAPGSASRTDADHLLTLLDLLLPHRGSSAFAAILLRAASISGSWDPYIGGIRMAGRSASLLDGVRDMCEAVNQPQMILRGNMVSSALQKIMGKKARLYVELFHMELAFENGGAEVSDFTEKVNHIYMEGEAQEESEICDIAAMLLIRFFISKGSLSTSVNLLDSYARRNAVKRAGRNDREIRRVRTEIQILRGDTPAAGEWLRSAPDFTQFFVVEERYDYMLEIKALMMLGREEEALILTQRLETVFEDYRRDYLLVRTRILKAVILFRREDSSWKTVLAGALRDAEKYHLCESVAGEGAALYPLLKKFRPEGISDSFLKKVRAQTQQMTVYYPNYLRSYMQPEEQLTQMERKVMQLLAGDMTTEEICDLLHITYNGLKFHRRNIYRKLGVRSRREAVQKARALGLCNG